MKKIKNEIMEAYESKGGFDTADGEMERKHRLYLLANKIKDDPLRRKLHIYQLLFLIEFKAEKALSFEKKEDFLEWLEKV